MQRDPFTDLLQQMAKRIRYMDAFSVFSRTELISGLRQRAHQQQVDQEQLETNGADGLSRREFLTLLGFGAGGAAIAASGASYILETTRDGTLTGMQTGENNQETGSCSDYETITHAAGETQIYRVGNGETFENKLIDVSAQGADCYIVVDPGSNDWAIRNIGIRGPFTVGDSDLSAGAQYNGGYSQVLKLRGNGTVENVYIGDGIINGVDKSVMNVGPEHGGHIGIHGLHASRFSSNANYVAGFGRAGDGSGGTMAFENCYVLNSTVAHFRCSGNLTIRNTTITNTNNVAVLPRTHGNASDVVTSRGIRADYAAGWDGVTVENCDIDIRNENTCNYEYDYNVNSCSATAVTIDQEASPGQIVLNDCEVRGSISSGVTQNNVGNNPDASPPAGVPMTPEEAACGASSAGSVSGDGSVGSGSPC